jgi:monoamine oxidase
MPRLSRRSLIAASAASAANAALAPLPLFHPAMAAPAKPQSAGPVDVIIIGAGAAGIAAARRIAAAGAKYTVLEAADHVGGRCITDTRTFGVPYDLGAHWLYAPETNPLTRLAPRRTVEIYPAPASQKVRVGRRYAREGELEDFLSAEVRATRAIADAARKADVPSGQALPNDLADWRSTVEFVLGPYACGKDLAQVSALDLSRSAERTAAAFCRQGLGTLLATLGDSVAVELNAPVKSINSRRPSVDTAKGTLTARAVIVTASTNVLAANRIQFDPELPHRTIDAFARLSLGSYDHIALELLGNPLSLQSDDLVFEKSSDGHTAAMLANVSGTQLCVIDVAGGFGRELSAQGKPAMVDFATEWLARLYGTEVKKAIGRTYATNWNAAPYVLGAASAAVPGAQVARRVLMEPINDGVWFAGEAAHETAWGTVGGAWESGERAADAVLRKLGLLKTPAPPAPQAEVETPAKRKSRRVQPSGTYYGSYGSTNIMREENRR